MKTQVIHFPCASKLCGKLLELLKSNGEKILISTDFDRARKSDKYKGRVSVADSHCRLFVIKKCLYMKYLSSKRKMKRFLFISTRNDIGNYQNHLETAERNIFISIHRNKGAFQRR